MGQAVYDFVLRLIGDIPQHPFEFKHHRLRNEYVTDAKQLGGNTCLDLIIPEVKTRRDVRDLADAKQRISFVQIQRDTFVPLATVEQSTRGLLATCSHLW